MPLTLKCFNCNEEGHQAANCTKKILQCNLCKKLGFHVDEQCNRSSSSNLKNYFKTENVLNIDSSNKTNEKILKEVKVNDEKLRAYDLLT